VEEKIGWEKCPPINTKQIRAGLYSKLLGTGNWYPLWSPLILLFTRN
jgi:hypothetical protein